MGTVTPDGLHYKLWSRLQLIVEKGATSVLGTPTPASRESCPRRCGSGGGVGILGPEQGIRGGEGGEEEAERQEKEEEEEENVTSEAREPTVFTVRSQAVCQQLLAEHSQLWPCPHHAEASTRSFTSGSPSFLICKMGLAPCTLQSCCDFEVK